MGITKVIRKLNMIHISCSDCGKKATIKYCNKCDEWKNRDTEYDKRCQYCKDCKKEMNKKGYEKRKAKMTPDELEKLEEEDAIAIEDAIEDAIEESEDKSAEMLKPVVVEGPI